MATQLKYAHIERATTPGRYFDARSGLHLLVRAQDRKYWIFPSTHDGRRQETRLGVFPRVSLADPPGAAQHARTMLDQGTNPLDLRAKEERALAVTAAPKTTFRGFATGRLDTKRSESKNNKHAAV